VPTSAETDAARAARTAICGQGSRTHRLGVGSAATLGRVRGLVGSPARALALTLLAGALTGVLAGCATSGPANLVPTDSAAPSPDSSESLLIDSPGPGTATGTLAPGFPASLVPVPPGAVVLVSAAQPQPDGTWQISLDVRTTQDTQSLLAAVSAPLEAAGFTASPPSQPDPALAGEAAFVRSNGAEFILIGILDHDDQRTMTLGGTIKQ